MSMQVSFWDWTWVHLLHYTVTNSELFSTGSEDEIEKLSDSVLHLGGGDDLEKQAKQEHSTHVEGTPGTAKRNDRQDEEEDDCVIQCLSYTLQCCECVISWPGYFKREGLRRMIVHI